MSAIEWTDETLNVVVGCQRVSPGCENCYAEKVAHRGMSPQHKGLTVVGKAGVRWSGEVRLVPEQLEKPLRWRKPRRIFVCSMADLFHPSVPNEFIAAVLGLAAATPQHTYQILTKRPQRMREFFAWLDDWKWMDGRQVARAGVCRSIARDYVAASVDMNDARWPLPNVWLGVSVEDQQRADERIPVLLECPAALRFLSCEPLLGPVDLSAWLETPTLTDQDLDMPDGAEVDGLRREGQNFRRVAGIGWAIVGGESGPGARECDLGDVRSIVQQCQGADVPVFVKQLGARPVRRQQAQTGHGSMGQYEVEADDLVEHLLLTSRKGADPSEWPADLRVQEMPRIGGAP